MIAININKNSNQRCIALGEFIRMDLMDELLNLGQPKQIMPKIYNIKNFNDCSEKVGLLSNSVNCLSIIRRYDECRLTAILNRTI